MLKRLRWFFIRLLLTDCERVLLHEAGERYFDILYKRFREEKYYEFPEQDVVRIGDIMKGISGPKNFKRWS